jgi:predicted nucleic acid-binding protein
VARRVWRASPAAYGNGAPLYFDTSALIKLLVEEDGSEIAVQLRSSRHAAAVGVLAYAETRAVLAAAHRAGRLKTAAYRAAVTEFEALHATALVGVDDSLARRAGDLAAEQGLVHSEGRGAGAVWIRDAAA